MKNQIALTIDLEEYFHAANLAEVCPIKSWSYLPSRVEMSCDILLDTFDRYKQKGTFFVLGYCARANPGLIKKISQRGHEIASHGFAHKIAYFQNRKQFFRDVDKSKKLLEDISGIKVHGYRAPNFSIRDENLWAYDELTKAGYTYDSSLYPVYHHRYGNPHRSLLPEERSTDYGKLLVLPLAVYLLNLGLKEFRLPVAGGAYWRFLPRFLTATALKQIEKERTPVICYLHPWEIDYGQPHFANLSLGKKIRHYYGVKSLTSKLDYFMSKFNFSSIKNVSKDILPI
ncbi:MAG TPA: DUF3473 domain-containing protein [Oligoflexia bacterium]|nr:DUF3473 domain-containing protein [Oligoflexia bacterium]HMP49040.1 DUF3473 domain-containing protein [Oligoflexia bacterium]